MLPAPIWRPKGASRQIAISSFGMLGGYDIGRARVICVGIARLPRRSGDLCADISGPGFAAVSPEGQEIGTGGSERDPLIISGAQSSREISTESFFDPPHT